MQFSPTFIHSTLQSYTLQEFSGLASYFTYIRSAHTRSPVYMYIKYIVKTTHSPPSHTLQCNVIVDLTCKTFFYLPQHTHTKETHTLDVVLTNILVVKKSLNCENVLLTSFSLLNVYMCVIFIYYYY